jgi:hypothetical protein
MSENTSINYIFFLKATEEIDTVFFQLANLFSRVNITLLPVTLDEMKNIDRHKKHQIIICRKDLCSAQNFIEIKKSYLDFAMSRGHVVVYDISSFSEIGNSNVFQNKKSYYYFPLPNDMKQIVMNITIDYFKTRNEMDEWPGGRRSKIPTSTYENKN